MPEHSSSAREGGGELPAPSLSERPELTGDGWERRNLVAPDRLDELRELYESLDYEVRAESLSRSDFGPSCGGCAQVACSSYVLIYTRKRLMLTGAR